MRRIALALATVFALAQVTPVMAGKTTVTYTDEILIPAAPTGFTSDQQTWPSKVDCMDIQVTSPSGDWFAMAGQGTLEIIVEQRVQGEWTRFGRGVWEFGDGGKNGTTLPTFGGCRGVRGGGPNGWGAAQTRVRVLPTAPIRLGVIAITEEFTAQQRVETFAAIVGEDVYP